MNTEAPSPAALLMDSRVYPNAHVGGPPTASMSDEQKELKNEVSRCKILCPSCIGGFFGCLFCPCVVCPAQVNVKTEIVLLSFGKYLGTIREPGLYCVNQCGLTQKQVSTAVNSIEVNKQKVVDSRGNPVFVSGIVNWEVVDARRAVIDVTAYENFLDKQAEVVLKQIVSQHPYEAKPGSNEDSLKTEAHKIRRDIIELLQAKVARAGIRVIEYQFNEVSLAPEIASVMLVRQQAEANLDARKIIVEGAVNIAHDAVSSLKELGISMNNEEASKLAANLVITICSEAKVTPTVNVGQ